MTDFKENRTLHIVLCIDHNTHHVQMFQLLMTILDYATDFQPAYPIYSKFYLSSIWRNDKYWWNSNSTQSVRNSGTGFACTNQIPWNASENLSYGYAAAVIVVT